MSFTTFKGLLVLTVVALALSQTPTFPSPDPSWNKYQIKSCCPKGYIQIQNYCVKCNPPKFFDPIDNICRNCPADHTYSSITGRCECFKCDVPRSMNPVSNKCECKVVKGVQLNYKADTNECVCPSNLPLWNGKYCVTCPPATEYDPKEKQCYHCPQGFIRDYTSHQCVPGL